MRALVEGLFDDAALADGAPLPVVAALLAETHSDAVVAGVSTRSADRSASARGLLPGVERASA